jgi:hypothetical protein
VVYLQTRAVDDALDLLDVLITSKLLARAERESAKQGSPTGEVTYSTVASSSRRWLCVVVQGMPAGRRRPQPRARRRAGPPLR